MIEGEILTFNDSACDTLCVFIHPIGGQVHWYRKLAKEMASHASVLLIQIKNIEISDNFTSIEKIAIHYFGLIRPFYDKFNILLISWSFGCDIAFEIAKICEATLKRKQPIFIFDPQFLSRKPSAPLDYFNHIISKEMNFEERANFGKIKAIRSPKQLPGLISKVLNSLVSSIADKNLLRIYEKHFLIYLYNLVLKNRYVHNGKITDIYVIMADTDSLYYKGISGQADYNTWSSSADHIEWVSIPGDHYSILVENISHTVSLLVSFLPCCRYLATH